MTDQTLKVLKEKSMTQPIKTIRADNPQSEDSPWKGLYRVGSLSAALYVVLVVIPLVLLFTAPQPPLSGGTAILQYIADHKSVYIVELVSFVGLSLPAMVVFLALYRALEPLNKSYAAIGALVGIASEIIALALSSSPPSLHTGLLHLSNQYLTDLTASQAGRATLAAAAEGLMALSNAVNAAGILTALSILIFSLVMLKGIFWKGVGYLGILTGILGMVSETLREMIGPAYFVYGILLPAWFVAVGWKLFRLKE